MCNVHRPGRCGLSRCALFVIASAAASVALPMSSAVGQTLTVNQVDYYYDQLLHTANSRWGELNFEFTASTGPMYLNVVNLSAGSDWAVQNVPLLHVKELGPDPFTMTVPFDLLVADGTDVPSLNLRYTVTSTPLLTAPLVGTTGTFFCGTGFEITNSGVPSTFTNVNPGAPLPVPVGVPFPIFTWHANMTNVVQEKNYCGPGAAANSLGWLATANGFSLPGTKADAMREMAPNMGNNHDGNWDGEEMDGKLKFIKDHNLPLEVHYVGGVTAPNGAGSGNYKSPNGNGSARNDGAITWEWIQNEMAKGQDVEIMTNTHWVVVEGTTSVNGVNTIIYRDDPYQHGSLTTAGESAEISKRHKSSYFGANGHVNIGNGDEVLKAAVAESPIKPLCTLEWDPSLLTPGISGGPGIWDPFGPTWRGNRTDVAAFNHPWLGYDAAFGGGGTNLVSLNSGGGSMNLTSLVCYSPTTINPLTPTDSLAMQNRATFEILSPCTINVPLYGLNGMTVTGGVFSAPLTLGANNPITGRGTFSGGTTVLRDGGAIIELQELSLTSASTVILNNNTSGTNPSLNLPDDGIVTFGRLSNTGTVGLYGGTLVMQAPAAGGIAAVERMGTLALARGYSHLDFSTDGPVICQALFQRLAPRPPHSGLNVRTGNALGDTPLNSMVTFSVAPTLTNQILPYVTVNEADFATHLGNNTSLRPYTPTVAETGNINLLGPNSNAKPSVLQNLTNNLTVNSLNLPGNVSLFMGPFNLNLGSGGLLHKGGSVQIQGTGRLTAGGTAPGHLMAVVAGEGSSQLIVAAQITDNAGPNNIFGDFDDGTVTLVKSGRGEMILGPINTYRGGTHVTAGVLRITADQQLGAPTGPLELYGPPAGFFGPGSEPFTGVLSVDATMNTARPIGMQGGAIRVLDGGTLSIANNCLTGPTGGSLYLTSPATSPGSPNSNARVSLGSSQAGLTADKMLVIGDVVLAITAPQALGNATIKVQSGNRAGENNNVTMLKTGGTMSIENDIVMPPGMFDRFYIDGSGGSVSLSGNLMRADYNSGYGQLASSNNTTLLIEPGGMFNGGTGYAAVSGDVSIGRTNAWGGMIDNRKQNFLGVLSGARSEPDQTFSEGATPSRITFSTDFSARSPEGGGEFVVPFSVLASEAKSWNGGTSRPVPLDVPAGVAVVFTGNASGGLVLSAMDDVIKQGPGSVQLLYSGNTGAGQFATRGNNALIDIQAGRWVVKDTANAFDQFAPIVTDATTGVTDLVMDGGHDPSAPSPGNGVVNYQVRNGATLVALFGNDDGPGGEADGGSPHTMHFNLTLNPGGNAASVATIQVGDESGPGAQPRLPLVIGNAPISAIPTPTTNWTGVLRKTGLGQLTLSRQRTALIAAGSTLKIVEGRVMVEAAGINDPLSGGVNPVVVEMNTGATLQIAGGSSTVRHMIGDPGAVQLDTGAVLTMASSSVTSNISALTIAGATNAWTGKLDMGDNKMVIDYSGVSPRPTHQNQIRQGYAGGPWSGNGITSGPAAIASTSSDKTAIGFAEATDLYVSFPAVFYGQTVDADSLLMRYTLAGDATLNGVVNSGDFNLLAIYFGTTGQYWYRGDFTYEGDVNSADFNVLASNFGKTLVGETGFAAGAMVPEPALTGLFALAGGLLLRRRR